MKQTYLVLAQSQNLYFEGEDPTDPADPVVPPEDPVVPAVKTFTQEEVNKLMANNRQKLQSDFATASKELNQAKLDANASQEEIATLKSQTTVLEESLMTEKELADRKLAQTEEQQVTALADATTKATFWETRHYNSLIAADITEAAALEKAHNPAQVVQLLRDNSKVVTDAEGTLSVQITLDAVDKDGKATKLVLDPKAALKEYASRQENMNLFTAPGTGGLGMNRGRDNTPVNPKTMTPAEYLEYRKELKIG